MLKKRWIFLIMVSLFLAIFALGCPPGEQPEAEPVIDEPTRLRVTQSWPLHIDPAIGSDYVSSTALTNLYSTLIYPTPDGGIEPHLAKEWVVSDDKLTYRFILNEGVMFHDGTELTAADVKFSFDRLVAIGQGFAYIFKDRVSSVEVIDDHTVEFHMARPFGPFLTTLTRLYIVNKDLVMANLKEGPFGEFGDYGKEFLNTNSAGSGAYMVKEFDVATRLVMEKFPEYFAFIDPLAPDIFELIGTTEAVTVRTGITNREIEISDQWQTAETFASLDEIEGVEIAKWPDGGQLYLMMHNRRPPLDCIYVRRALSWAFNYDVVVQNIFPGTEQARGPVSSVLPGWNPDLFQFSYDLEKAKAELAKSEYAGRWEQFPIEYAWTAEVPDLEKIALMLQAEAQKIGLTVEIVKTPWMSMIDKAASMETTPHIMSIWVAPHYGEAGSILEARYHSANVGSWEQTEWLKNEEIDRMIEEAIATVDQEARFELYRQIQEKIVELVPTIFAYDNMQRHAYQAEYIVWPQSKDPVPVMGYNLVARFIQVDPVRRAELLGR